MSRRRPAAPAPVRADRKVCPTKVAFYAENVAKQRAREISDRDRGSGEMTVYRCSACGFWHLGHSDGGTGTRHTDFVYQARGSRRNPLATTTPDEETS